MKKLLTSLCTLCLALAIYSVPSNYQDWKSQGNYFWGGFHGYASYINWLTPENRDLFLNENVTVFSDQTLKQWKKDTDLDEEWMYRVER